MSKKIRNWYSQIKRILYDVMVNALAGSFLCPKFLRRYIYLTFGMKIQSKNINPKAYFSGSNIAVGRDCYVGYMVFFDGIGGIIIEDCCNIAMKCTFVTSTHCIGASNRRAGDNQTKMIKVGRGSWIGANSTILPGVTIGEGCIIGAGSVVVGNCDSNSLYAGVPAKKIKELD